MRGRGAALTILLLLVPALPVPLPFEPAIAQEVLLPGVRYAWWDEAWHMRVPVLLEPRIVDRLHGGTVDLAPLKIRNYPVQVEVDFAQAIREAGPEGFGWPRDAQGRLASFTFDPQSVRVVEHDRFRGCPLVRERATGELRCAQPGDRPEDALVPASFSPGLWENAAQRDAAFDAQRNPVATLQWVVPGAFTGPRLFFVYFDVLENGAKPAPRYRAEDSGVLDGLHFVRWGTDILGLAPAASAGSAGVLLAQALYDNTTIALFKYVSRSVEPAEMARATVHALDSALPQQPLAESCVRLGLHFPGTVCLEVPVGESFYFRALANRPVIVGLSNQEGAAATPWYPSRDAGLAGTDFVFRAVGTGSQGQGRVLVLSPHGPAQVRFQGIDESSFTLPITIEGSRSFPVTEGLRYAVHASRPVLVLGVDEGTGAANTGAAFVTPEGAPLGPHLVGYVRSHFSLVNAGAREAELLLGAPLGNPDHPLALRDEPLPPGPGGAVHAEGTGGGEVWRFDMRDDTPLWGKAGEEGLVPLGGLGGQIFPLSLKPEPFSRNDPRETRLALKAFYNATRVVVRNATSGAEVVNATLGIHDWVERSAAGKPLVPYGDWLVEASKPVGVFLVGPRAIQYGETRYAASYMAKVEPPLATLGPGEFHGFAVGWEDKVRTLALGPGERARVKLTIVNLGRGVGGQGFTDDIAISKELSAPPNASLPSVDLSSVLEAGVPSFEKRDVTLSVAVPADASPGTVYQVNVTARSRGNPNFADVARVVVTVQIRHAFTMRFVDTNGTSLQRILEPGSATCADIELRNTGTGDVNVLLQMSPVPGSDAALGFEPRLLPRVAGACEPRGESLVDEEGGSAEPLLLRRGEARVVTLFVRAPQGTQPLPLEVEVQGTAREDASVRQQVGAVLFTNVEAKVRLTVANDTQLVAPGENATYAVLVENVGNVETPIEYGTTGLLPPGWNVSFVDAPPLLLGRGRVDASGRALDRAEFLVNVTAAREAPVALVVPVNVVATSSIVVETAEAARAFKQSDSAKLTAIVANNFTLEQPEAAPLAIDPGEPVALAFELRNAANGNFTLRVAPGSLPRNWSLAIEEPRNATLLERGDRLPVRVRVEPELATPAGVYEVSIVFLAEDAFTKAARFRNVTLLVRSTTAFRVEPDPRELVLAPGAQREVSVRVLNSGNLPIAARLSAQAPPGYQASFPNGSRAELEPGAELRLAMRLAAPTSPSEEPQELSLLAVDERSGRRAAAEIRVQTARLDLVALEATLATPGPRVGEPAAVVVRVENRGTIPANNVTLALEVNGRGVRNESLRALPPGEPRSIVLPWTVDEAPREVSVVLDPEDRFHETDEGNNRARLSLERGLPGPGGALVLAALAGAALAAARRRIARGGRLG